MKQVHVVSEASSAMFCTCDWNQDSSLSTTYISVFVNEKSIKAITASKKVLDSSAFLHCHHHSCGKLSAA